MVEIDIYTYIKTKWFIHIHKHEKLVYTLLMIEIDIYTYIKTKWFIHIHTYINIHTFLFQFLTIIRCFVCQSIMK
jgi:hypothetical protein